MVFLINPNKESLFIVVEDSASIRPITSSSTVEEHIAGTGLLEKESTGLQGILFFLSHATKRVVLTLEVLRHGGGSQSIGEKRLYLTSLLSISSRGEGKTIDGATSANASRHDVLVKLLGLGGSHGDVSVVHVRGVGVLGLVSVPSINNQVHDILESIIGSDLTGSNTDTEVGGIEGSLDGLIKGHARGSLDISILSVQLRVLLQDLAQKRLVGGVDDGEVANGINLGTGGTLGDAEVSLNALDSVEDLINLIRSGRKAHSGTGNDGRASHKGSAASRLRNSREHFCGLDECN
jgi:hypothetical protein